MKVRIASAWMLLLQGWMLLLFSGCIRDDLEACPPLQIQLDVKDKNYLNVEAVYRLGLAEIVPEDLPFADYISTLQYRLTDAETGEIIVDMPLEKMVGDGKTVAVPVPEDLPFGRYVLTAWGNLSEEVAEAQDSYTALSLHPNNSEGLDVYLASDTLVYNEVNYAYTVGLGRVKGKLIITAEGLPEKYRLSEKRISNISGHVDVRGGYSEVRSFDIVTVWEHPAHILTETYLAPSVRPSGSVCKVRFYVGEEVSDNWIAPEDVSFTMRRNELTVLRYVYDPCCCRFKIYILVNDNWELLHAMEID